PALDTGQGEERQEHEDNDHGAEDDGAADFPAGFVNDTEGGPGMGRRVVLPEAAVDVLDVNDGVVHEFAEGDGDAAQRHDIDGERVAGEQADQAENQCGDGERERDGRQRDERRAEIQQKEEQDHDDEDSANDQRLADVVDAAVDEIAELEQIGVDDVVGGQPGFSGAEG